MKGLVFTTFFEHVKEKYGEDVVDDIIEAAELPNKGAYTSAGTYPFEEMVSLVIALVASTGTKMPVVLEEFGRTCFQKWVNYVPEHFVNRSLFDVMANIDSFHEIEVRKLYPNAELPSFQVESREADKLVLRYYSCKPLADLAVGVIKGAASHLDEKVDVHHSPGTGSEGEYVRINIDILP